MHARQSRNIPKKAMTIQMFNKLGRDHDTMMELEGKTTQSVETANEPILRNLNIGNDEIVEFQQLTFNTDQSFDQNEAQTQSTAYQIKKCQSLDISDNLQRVKKHESELVNSEDDLFKTQ